MIANIWDSPISKVFRICWNYCNALKPIILKKKSQKVHFIYFTKVCIFCVFQLNYKYQIQQQNCNVYKKYSIFVSSQNNSMLTSTWGG